jgi:hypothetical protein
MSVWNWLFAGIALLTLFAMLAAWSQAEEDCADHGKVARNVYGWPTCVENTEGDK